MSDGIILAKLDAIREKVDEIYDKMFIGNGEKSVMVRIANNENDINNLKNYKTEIKKRFWAIYGGIGSIAVVITGWLVNNGILQWLVEKKVSQ